MIVYEKNHSMPWNLENIRFLFPPDDFTGSFSNTKMQERLKAIQKEKIRTLLTKLAQAADPHQAMRVLNPGDHIRFVINNMDAFCAHNQLESTVFQLFFLKNTPFVTAGDPAIWDMLFRKCSPEKSRALGAPLPAGAITAYRGSVTGITKAYCWTLSHEEAAWFLNRWQDKDLGGGTVYKTSLSADDTLFYRISEHRREVILLPSFLDQMEPQIITELDAG